jgi:hypothetical protein
VAKCGGRVLWLFHLLRLQGGDTLGHCVIGQGSAWGMAVYLRGRKSGAGEGEGEYGALNVGEKGLRDRWTGEQVKCVGSHVGCSWQEGRRGFRVC